MLLSDFQFLLVGRLHNCERTGYGMGADATVTQSSEWSNGLKSPLKR